MSKECSSTNQIWKRSPTCT